MRSLHCEVGHRGTHAKTISRHLQLTKRSLVVKCKKRNWWEHVGLATFLECILISTNACSLLLPANYKVDRRFTHAK